VRSWASTGPSASPSPRARWRRGTGCPSGAPVFLSLADRDKAGGLVAARRFASLGFAIAATAGTAAHLEAHGVAVDTLVGKVGEDSSEPTAVDLLAAGKVDLVVNTPRGLGPRADGQYIRTAAGQHRVLVHHHRGRRPRRRQRDGRLAGHTLTVRSIQEWHADGQGEQLGLDL
jgi:carbamoyl-phosphate synthase large subunit